MFVSFSENGKMYLRKQGLQWTTESPNIALQGLQNRLQVVMLWESNWLLLYKHWWPRRYVFIGSLCNGNMDPPCSLAPSWVPLISLLSPCPLQPASDYFSWRHDGLPRCPLTSGGRQCSSSCRVEFCPFRVTSVGRSIIALSKIYSIWNGFGGRKFNGIKWN